MKITIENTNQIVELIANGTSIPARLWKGETEGGIEVNVLVTRIGVDASEDQAAFQAELQETPTTRVESYATIFPLRLIL